jgi:hypothetical protein
MTSLPRMIQKRPTFLKFSSTWSPSDWNVEFSLPLPENPGGASP